LITGFFPPDHTAYHPWGEFDGVAVEPSPEVPERLTIILNALKGQKVFPVKLAKPAPVHPEQLLAVHRQDYLTFLSNASRQARTYPVGMPSVFPITPMNIDKEALGFEGQLGHYLFDTSAPIMPNTYAAALDSAACAISATKDILQGEQLSLALCRPPGHHAGPAYGGGYCFLNNAAIAAAHLQATLGKVALVDIDFHHGNGSQEIFYETDQVLCVSIHGHPENNFPYYWGYPSEQGKRAGKGFNYNFPLRKGSSSTYLETLNTALAKVIAFKPSMLVLSAGFDTFAKDPLGDFSLKTNDFEAIGTMICKLELPLIVVLEGGYHGPQLGKNFLALMTGLLP
jgi:acetoin utilization deacetylase AcuC-like enzyme